VMVASFRDGVAAWLDRVLPADLYVRSDAQRLGSEQLSFSPELPAVVAQAPGVARVGGIRSQRLVLSTTQPAVWLLARPLGDRPETQLPLVGTALPAQQGRIGVYVSEAMPALYGVQVGGEMTLPIGGRALTVQVLGIWRDYARQFGSIAIDLDAYRRLTGDRRLNELAITLSPDASPARIEDAARDAVQAEGGDPRLLGFMTTGQLKGLSLRIFDRSFAVTRYLQVVAIAIGLAGVAASLSAQVLARRREFGLLAHLGLTRAQMRRMVTLEALCWMVAGALVGIVLGLAISAVLVYVVNPQSFHWTMDLVVPWPQVMSLAAAVLVVGVGTAAFSARRASSADAVRAVREDW